MWEKFKCWGYLWYEINKANLRDLIAATGLVILLKFDSNRRLISPCDLEIWWMTSKKNKAPLPDYIKLCASFQIHRWIQNGVTVRKRSIRIKIGDFLSRMTLKFYGWPWKTIGRLFYTTLSFVQHFKAIGIFKLELSSGNAQFRSKWAIFCPVWSWKLTNDLEKQQGTSSILRQDLCIISKPSVLSNLGYSPETLNLSRNCRYFCPAWP